MPLADLFDTTFGTSTAQIQAILRTVRRHLAMDVGFISEFRDGQRVFRFTDGEIANTPIAVGGADPLEKSFCHYVVRGVLPKLMHDARMHPQAAAMPVTHALPVGAHLSVPLQHRDGTVFGTVCCFSFTADRSLTTRDLGVLRMCADIVSAVIEKDRDAAHDRTARQERIREVLARRAVEMVFQPVYGVAAERVLGFEALARFQAQPQRAPDLWFAEAAEVGLGVELEFLAADKAFEAFARLDRSLSLAVNLSPAAILSERFAATLARVPVERTVVELTEHAVVQSYDALRAALAPWRARGLRLAIDDVGAGHSTFRHVLDLAPQSIKLDRSLIRGIDTDSARRALSEALISYGRSIGCEVVAEGLETEAEYAVLRDIGITRAQGYLIGRPLPLDEALRLPPGRA